MSTIRPMRDGDEVGAEAAWDLAFRTLLTDNHLPIPPRTPETVDHGRRRMNYLLTTDPGGSWIAESEGRIVGVTQAHIRGGTWVLATLGVVTEHQEKGLGRRLLDRALAYGDPQSPGVIFSSPDPRAVYRYMHAGFAIHPTATAFGPVRRPVSGQDSVRVGSTSDLGVVDSVDREVRGTSRSSDVEFQLGLGYQLLVDEEGGYAVVRGGRIAMLAALTEEVAVRLLLDAVARCPADAPVEVNWMTSRHQWAIRTLAMAGVSIHVHESVMTRGPWEPVLPYLPSGIFG
jgi:GNAT superfamily N-acetyltransferase